MPEDYSGYPGDSVELRCEVWDSSVIKWTSPEYVGGGGEELSYSPFENVGTVYHSPVVDSTFVNLTDKNCVDGHCNFSSSIYLYIKGDILKSDVACHSDSMTVSATLTRHGKTILFTA